MVDVSLRRYGERCFEARAARLLSAGARRRQEKGKTSKHLRLCPAMHGHVVPAGEEATGPERSIFLDPLAQNACDDGVQRLAQRGESVLQQHAQVDALRAVIKLA